jgi:molybdopterin molybdotransferase
MKLLNVMDAGTAEEMLVDTIRGRERITVRLPLAGAAGRVLAEDMLSSEFVPAFDRSTVDGYAVRSADTAAAGEAIPVFLDITGKIEMGLDAGFSLAPGTCAYVPTGGMLPEGADAAVMIEHTEQIGSGRIAIYQSASPNENIVRKGDDISPGETAARRGTKLGAGQIGALAALGIADVSVYEPLRLYLISTGDELIPFEGKPVAGQIRDINTLAIAALAEQNGYIVTGRGLIKDVKSEIKSAITDQLGKNDVICISGGSSQGEKDVTREIIDDITDGGVFTHGIAVKPGKPTILGYDKKTDTIIAGLPGHPAAAITIFDMMFCSLSRAYTYSPEPVPVKAFLSVNVTGSSGRSKCQAVSLTRTDGDIIATPVYGTSGMISTLAAADGYFQMDRNAEGLPAGAEVYVHLLF